MYAKLTGNGGLKYISGNNGGLKLSNIRTNATKSVQVDDKVYLYSDGNNSNSDNLNNFEDVPIVSLPDDISGDNIGGGYNRGQGSANDGNSGGDSGGTDIGTDNTGNTDRAIPALDAWRYYRVDKDVDAKFRKQFTPRSFAAADEEIAKMKHETAQSTTKQNQTMQITKEFRAH